MIRSLLPLMVLATNAVALADDATTTDGRLMGYKSSVAPPAASMSLIWLELIGLGVVGLGVLFISAKRTHLD
jgi:hypothetical protein